MLHPLRTTPGLSKAERRIALGYQFIVALPAALMLIAGVVALLSMHEGRSVAIEYGLWMIVPLCVATIIGRLISLRYLRPLVQLRRGAERMEAGTYEPLPVDRMASGEFSDLTRAFNHMVAVIASREAAQREQNRLLADLNQRMETVLNATNDGIALLDKEGRFMLVNRRFCELLGIRMDALLYQPISEAQALLTARLARPERLLSRLGPLTDQDEAHQVGVSEEIVEVLAAERRFVQVYTAPVRDDHLTLTGRIVALHDITRETEVDKMKTEFISVVSHELRTPLTSIKGYTDLLLTEEAGEINELQREFLEILEGSTNRLTNLINDVLDISRLESGHVDVKLERVNYQRIVTDVLRLMRASADEKAVSLDASMPSEWPDVRGDADKITQILANLVNNAIKYTPTGGWAKVSLEIQGGAMVTCVADSGIGISQDDQKKLFQKFFRADNSTTREAGGTGLGLSIVKTMVELLGGAVWMESEAGEGSRFYFSLPIYTEAAPESGQTGRLTLADTPEATRIAPEEIEAALVEAKLAEASLDEIASGVARERITGKLLDRGVGLVLVVDDDLYVREHLQHALHRMGYGVVIADEADQVLRRARIHRPDVILLNMLVNASSPGGMEGLSIQRTLASDPATAPLPVVAYSLVGDPVHGMLSLGAFSLLPKPLPVKPLAAALIAQVCQPGLPVRAPIVLSVALAGGDSEGDGGAQFGAERASLQALGVELRHAPSAADAISLAIAAPPDALLIDADCIQSAGGAVPDRALFDLLRALKSEDSIARIPILLLTQDAPNAARSAADARAFHLGPAPSANVPTDALAYLGDQVSRILRSRGIGRAAMPHHEMADALSSLA